MGEWHDLLEWLPIVFSTACGFMVGCFYSRFRGTGHHLNTVLYIIYKLHRNGTKFSPAETIVIQAAVDHLMHGRPQQGPRHD